MKKVGDVVTTKVPLFIKTSNNEPGESWACIAPPGTEGVITETRVDGEYLAYSVRFGEHHVELFKKLTPLERLAAQSE